MTIIFTLFSKKLLTNEKKYAIISKSVSESGGTGRRARLRGVWFTPYGFKSRFSHHSGVCCKGTTSETPIRVKITVYAGMAELADALDSGSSESNFMEVQVLLPAPNKEQ